MQPLQLTSPHMGAKNNSLRAADVRRLQTTIIANKPGRFHGKIDGEYGPQTAQAVYDIKNFDFGYLKPDRVAGDLFYAYLTGSKKPSAIMKRRAQKRNQIHQTLNYKIFEVMLSRLGETEHPANSNISYASRWYGLIGPWCAMAVTYAASISGSKVFKANKYCGYVPTLVADAINHRNKLARTFKPVTGNAVCYKFPGVSNAVADHIGVYASEADLREKAPAALRTAINDYGALGPGEFWSLEGNTGNSSDNNGGAQMLRKRNKNLVVVYFTITG